MEINFGVVLKVEEKQYVMIINLITITDASRSRPNNQNFLSAYWTLYAVGMRFCPPLEGKKIPYSPALRLQKRESETGPVRRL